MKKSVLCVSRSVLGVQDGTNIWPCNVSEIPEDAFHFINRSVCEEDPVVGYTLPQFLGYVALICQGEVLTYARKGNEARLHGMRSVGIGGHVDIDDFDHRNNKPYLSALLTSIEREVWEEVRYPARIGTKQLDSIIVDTHAEVGRVHVGVPAFIFIKHKDEITPNDEELLDPQWVSIKTLNEDRDQYENWSKLLIDLMQTL